MEDIWIYRSLLFAFIEFGLASFVLLRGNPRLKLPIAAMLIFLGGYQLGEYVFLATGNTAGLQFATFSTTMLPPIGLWIFEKLTNKRYFSLWFAVIAVGFGLGFLIQPNLLGGAQDCFCTVKYAVLLDNGHHYLNAWGVYYIGTLILSMGLAAFAWWKKWGDRRNLGFMFIAYASFFPVTFIITWLGFTDLEQIPSVMCALAIGAAFIATYVALKRPN